LRCLNKSSKQIFHIKTHNRERQTFDTDTSGTEWLRDIERGDILQLLYDVGGSKHTLMVHSLNIHLHYKKEIKSVVSHPELQMRNKKYTTPVLHGVHGKVNEIPGRITRVTASVDWKDQGWGKNAAAIMLVKVDEKGSKSKCTIFKIKTHQREQLTFDTNTHGLDFFIEMKKGDGLQLWYNVGGSGHKLDVYDLKVTVTYATPPTTPIVRPGIEIKSVVSHPELQMRNKKYTTPVLHGVHGRVNEIPGRITRVTASVDWKDQGWGKNAAAIMLVKVDEKGSKSKCTIFKIKTHQREQLTFDTITHGLDFFKDMKKGDGLQLWYSVGGSGHKLDVYDLKVTVTYATPPTTPIVRPGIFAIRSVSSGNYLDGRNPEHVGIQIHLTNRPPKGDKYLHWTLTKLGDGTYNMRSISSNLFVDGRDPQHKGRQVKLHAISKTQASSSHNFKWRITEFTYGGRTRVAIQSVSSGLYLDGRNPNHTGNQLYLTARNPQGDKYLMWDLESMEEKASVDQPEGSVGG
jgi:hypothetical protein